MQAPEVGGDDATDPQEERQIRRDEIAGERRKKQGETEAEVEGPDGIALKREESTRVG